MPWSNSDCDVWLRELTAGPVVPLQADEMEAGANAYRLPLPQELSALANRPYCGSELGHWAGNLLPSGGRGDAWLDEVGLVGKRGGLWLCAVPDIACTAVISTKAQVSIRTNLKYRHLAEGGPRREGPHFSPSRLGLPPIACMEATSVKKSFKPGLSRLRNRGKTRQGRDAVLRWPGGPA